MRSDFNLAARVALTLGMSAFCAQGLAEEPETLFCAASQAIVCPEQSECTRTAPENVNLPRLFKIDLVRREVVSLRTGGEPRTSQILNLSREDGIHVLQGAEKDKGWTATIDGADGRLTITASSPGEAYAVFGTCASTF